MAGYEWGALESIGAILVAITVLWATFWFAVTQRASVVADKAISEKAVLATHYNEHREHVEIRLAQLEKSNAGMEVIRAKIDGLEGSMDDLKRDVRDGLSQQRDDMNGAIKRVDTQLGSIMTVLTSRA